MNVLSYASIVETQDVEIKVKKRWRDLTRPGASLSESIGKSGRNVTGGIISVSFKEVVERFAENSGIEFFAKSGKGPADRQLYQFGPCVCYIEHDVLFIHSSTIPKNLQKRKDVYNKEWSPIDLEELLSLIKS
jgi:hypothetical protein